MDENGIGEDEWMMMADETSHYEGEVYEWMTTDAENNPYDGSMLSSLATTSYSDSDSTTHVEVNDDDGFKLENENIAHVERLRLEFSQLMSRKNVVMDMLIDVFGNDVVKLDVISMKSTQDEDEAFYENQLKEFKEKKEASLKRAQKLKETINIKTQYLESKRLKCLELMNKQIDLELKTALNLMIDEQTKQPMVYDDVVGMLNACVVQDKILNKYQLKYIKASDICNKLKNEISHLQTIFDVSNYQKWLQKKEKIEMEVQQKKETISKEKAKITTIKNDSFNISKNIMNLKNSEKIRIEKLEQLKEEWKRCVEIKSHNKDILKQRIYNRQLKSQNIANQLLLKDYQLCEEKSEKNKNIVTKLRQKCSELQANIEYLKAVEQELVAGSRKITKNQKL